MVHHVAHEAAKETGIKIACNFVKRFCSFVRGTGSKRTSSALVIVGWFLVIIPGGRFRKILLGFTQAKNIKNNIFTAFVH